MLSDQVEGHLSSANKFLLASTNKRLGDDYTVTKLQPPTDTLSHLGWQDDAHVTQVHIDSSQVLSVPGAASQHGDFGQVLESLPLPPDVANLAHNHHVLQLVEVEVGGSQGHHQVPESDQGGVLVGKQTNLEWTSWLSVSCTTVYY